MQVSKREDGELEIVLDPNEIPHTGITSEIVPGATAGIFGDTRDWCADCGGGQRITFAASNHLEAAIVGIARCGGACSVTEGACK